MNLRRISLTTFQGSPADLACFGGSNWLHDRADELGAALLPAVNAIRATGGRCLEAIAPLSIVRRDAGGVNDAPIDRHPAAESRTGALDILPNPNSRTEIGGRLTRKAIDYTQAAMPGLMPSIGLPGADGHLPQKPWGQRKGGLRCVTARHPTKGERGRSA